MTVAPEVDGAGLTQTTEQSFGGKPGLFARLNQPVANFIARLPLRLESKLLVAFLGSVALLILLGLAGLAILAENGLRTETLIKTEQRVDAYQHLEHHAHNLLLTVSSSLWMPGKTTSAAVQQIKHLQENLAALHPATSGEAAQIEDLRREYASFIDMATREIGLLHSGDVDMAGALLAEHMLPQAAKIGKLTDRLVDAADADMGKNIAAAHGAYDASRNGLIGYIVAAALIGTYLAHAIATFVVGPLREIGRRLGLIACGQFSGRVEVANRDEIGVLAQNVNRASEQLGQLYADLEVEKERSEEMLYQILPRQIVQRMNAGETLIADRIAEATILFSDLAGFTELSDRLAPEEVVDVLDVLFSRYDALVARMGLEKIKTIGDGYMVACGVIEPRVDHAQAIAEMALAMRAATDIATRALGVIGQPLRVRIGIHSGPLIAGVLGSSNLVYDIWGDTVNTASRMEHYGETGRISVSATTRDLLGNQFRFEPREVIDVKGKGAMETFFLERHIGPRHFANVARQLAAARADA
jgi:class 3 adenylate cyclase